MNSNKIKEGLIGLLQIGDRIFIYNDYKHPYFYLFDSWSIFDKTESSIVIVSENYVETNTLRKISNDDILLDEKNHKLYINFTTILYNKSIGFRNE